MTYREIDYYRLGRTARFSLKQLQTFKNNCRGNPGVIESWLSKSKKNNDNSCALYALQDIPSKRIKIGHSQNITVRLQSAFTFVAEPKNLILVGLFPCQENRVKDVERAFHRWLREYRLHGEWFLPSLVVIEFVQTNMSHAIGSIRPKLVLHPEHDSTNESPEHQLTLPCKTDNQPLNQELLTIDETINHLQVGTGRFQRKIRPFLSEYHTGKTTTGKPIIKFAKIEIDNWKQKTEKR